MPVPLAVPIVAGGMALGNAISNWLGNNDQADRLNEAYDRIQGLADQAVNANANDIQAFKNLVGGMYGNGTAAYQSALEKFLNSPVYQNKDFTYGKQVDEFLDPAMNQRIAATTEAINNAAATGGNRFSSDYMGRLSSRVAAESSAEWEKAYNRLMQDRQMAMQEYNTNSQNGWNNYNADQTRLKDALTAYGSDRDKYYEGQGTALGARIQNRLGGLQTQAQTIMGGANAKQGTSGWDLASGLLGAGGNFLANYFGGK